MTTQDRKNRLGREISERQAELRVIWDAERLESNKSMVGRCFSEYVDNGDNHIEYTWVTDINEFGTLSGYRFKVYESFGNRVEFSLGKTGLPDYKELDGREISLSKFLQTYSRYLTEVLDEFGKHVEDVKDEKK